MSATFECPDCGTVHPDVPGRVVCECHRVIETLEPDDYVAHPSDDWTDSLAVVVPGVPADGNT